MNPYLIESSLPSHVREIFGKPCTLCQIFSDRSLSLEFGEITVSPRTGVGHGEWEIGTYCSSWRVVRGREVLCSRHDFFEEEVDFRNSVGTIVWGRCVGVEPLSDFDVRVRFEDELAVDFLSIVEDDELLHLFFPNKIVTTYSPTHGWMTGRSDEPWNVPERKQDSKE